MKRNGKDMYRGSWEKVGVRKSAQELLITCMASDRYSVEALQNVENGKTKEKEYVSVYNWVTSLYGRGGHNILHQLYSIKNKHIRTPINQDKNFKRKKKDSLKKQISVSLVVQWLGVACQCRKYGFGSCSGK